MRCAACGFGNPEGFRFCGSCGSALPDADVVEEFRADRRRVVVLFADVVGYSTLSERLDPEDLNAAMREIFAGLTASVPRREGMVEKYIGDAVVVVFGAPQAHEDDPERAVETALDMAEYVDRRSREMRSPLAVRIGINLGLVFSGPVGDGTQAGVMGDAVNVAARLQQSAEPGDILVSDGVWRHVRTGYRGTHVGTLRVKGRAQRVDAFRITGRRPPSTPRLTPFIGRDREIGVLEARWRAARAGSPQIVSLRGEAGVGKSRLLAEFPPRTDGSDIRVQCSPERPFGAFRSIVEQVLGRVLAGVDELATALEPMGLTREDAQWLAVALGHSDPPRADFPGTSGPLQRVQAAAHRFLSGLSSSRPALVVLNDVHTADASSLETLNRLMELLSDEPLMLLLIYRPEVAVRESGFLATHTVLEIHPLARRETIELAEAFMGTRGLPEELALFVAERAEGNPFFVEQLLQTLLEVGAVSVTEDGVLVSSLDVDVPDTVERTILARLDRLSQPTRHVLECASVIGPFFPEALLRAVARPENDVLAALEDLVASQFLMTASEKRWTFKHALTQEVTYGTLLKQRRRTLHRRAAESLEAEGTPDPGSLGVLAEHYARAEVLDKARRYSLAAGDLATEQLGHAEAKSWYETTLRLWGAGDEHGRLDVLTKLGQAAYHAGDLQTARSSLMEGEAAWRDEGETQRAGRLMALLGWVYWLDGQSGRSIEVLRRAVALLEPGGTTEEMVWALVWSSGINVQSGDPRLGLEHATRGLAMAVELGMKTAQAHLLNQLGTEAAGAGDPKGLDRVRQAQQMAEESGDPDAIGRAFAHLSDLLWEFAQNREAVAVCERGREVMRRLGSPMIEWFLAANQAQSLVELGRYADGEAMARESLRRGRAMENPPIVSSAAQSLASGLTRRGSYQEARELLDEALPLTRGIGGADFLASSLLEEAELGEALGHHAQAVDAIEEAVKLAKAGNVLDQLRVLPAAARMLPNDRVTTILDRARGGVRHPAHEAVLQEAEGAVSGNPSMFRKAADLYEAHELHYQEARCRLESEELDRAGEIINHYSLQAGPMGSRLRILLGSLR